MKKLLLVFIFLFLPFVFVVSPIFAESEPVRLNLKENVKVNLSSPPSSPIQIQNRENVRERVKNVLEGQKLQACKAREEVIRTRQRSLLRIATGSLKRMDDWVEKLKKFYEYNLLPNAKEVSGYDDLLAEIERTRTEVVNSLGDVSVLVDEFGCEGDDPKGVYNDYREMMQKTKTNLFEYRKATKNLLVAIRRVALSSSSPLVIPKAE